MLQEHSSWTMADGRRGHLHIWPPKADSAFVLLIIHGMGEHGGRYREFADHLNRTGGAVYAPDLRGHGHTRLSREAPVHFADEDGWELVVDDIHSFVDTLRQRHPAQPVFLLGHSMGSLLARRYLQRYKDVAGVILSGTGGHPGWQGKLGLWLAKIEMRRLGLRQPSPLLKKLLFGGFNRHFSPRTTGLEWLTRDQEQVNLYLQDEAVASHFSAAFFRDLIKGTLDLHQPDQLRATEKELPILLLSGDKDPLGGFGKAVQDVYRQLVASGCKDVELKLYPDARHEILNEISRQDVYEDIQYWIQKKLAQLGG